MIRQLTTIILAGVVAIALAGCAEESREAAEIGTEANPIKIAVLPSLDTQKLVKTGKKLSELLEKETGLKSKVDVLANYSAVVQSMGAGNTDVGFLSPLPYVLAHDQYGVKVILRVKRDNSTEYWSFVIARKDSGINKLADLKGKKFAYGDPLSTSGCLYAKDLIRRSGHDPERFFSQAIYAGAHDKVVMAVYNRQVDAGAIYGGVSSDAREKVVETYPDVMDRTKVVAKSVAIPNDTVSVRKGLPAGIVRKVKDGLLKVAASDEGRIAIMDLYGIDGFVPTKDSDYDSVRGVAQSEKIKLEQLDK